jgi:hypothetical protein
MADKKWKIFERLVAAIHIAEQQGACVTWNEKINGRQFDVTIRFKYGFYEYLTVIECKDYEAPVPVKEVEAFITKSRGVGADKAVMVSSSGYQAGGKEVARQNKVELYTLDLINEVPENLISEELIPAVNVYDVRFKPHKGKEICLFDKDGSLEYLLRQAEIFLGDEIVYPAKLIQDYLAGLTEPIGNKPRKAKIPLAKGAKLIFPGLEKPAYVSSLSFTYKLIATRHFVTAGPSTSVSLPHYKLENELTGQSTVVKSKDVALGFDTKLTPGRFYHIPKIGCSYYCREINNELATLILLESYRDGHLFQMTFTQYTKYEKYYVEVTDREEIERLSKIHAAYLKGPERPPDLPPAKAPKLSNVLVRYDEVSNLMVIETSIKKEG